MASIPPGRWMSYQDLAIAAGGRPGAGMALGQGLMRRDEMVDGVHRVLDRHGRINEKWQGKHPSLSFDAQDRAGPAARYKPE
jgi:alkylated DNA nucleotide flippase Atl1